MRPHEKLEVYRMAHALALRVHAMTLRLPKFEMYEQGSQVRRSAKSAAAQVVEGHALRQYKAEYLHYLARAYASSEETGEHLALLMESGSAGAQKVECTALRDEYHVLSRKLFNYMRAVERKHEKGWGEAGMRDER